MSSLIPFDLEPWPTSLPFLTKAFNDTVRVSAGAGPAIFVNARASYSAASRQSSTNSQMVCRRNLCPS
jgi:hypothetical protein